MPATKPGLFKDVKTDHLGRYPGYVQPAILPAACRSGSEIKCLRKHAHLLRSSHLGLTIRGCPYACADCINSRLKEILRGKGPFIRFIATDLVIKELEWAVKNIPHLKSVTLDDDDFFLRSKQEMDAFLEAYRKRINLPFYYLQATIRQVSESELMLFRKHGIRITFLKIGL